MSYSDNPRAPTGDNKTENPGTVLSDSLAADSINSGGDFAANSDDRGVSAQPARSTTTNTTDTSNATRLDPAPDAEARSAQEGWDDQNQLDAASRLGGQGSSAPGDVSNSAPSQADNFEPKGQNLTEGGFDSSGPNASFNTDIGGKNDPGRVGLNKFEETNVPSAGGAGPRESEITNDGQFDALKETSA
ncbi:hypothetical protein CLAFUW4_01430 [Fulvia fulva]|uniref:Uncharacterized protein n=1 Tax=Passalora fulva TaxID=5499 RepID=A0A9Q8L6X5_PASFU|nr:uncharacterized protein CLAFUR5_01432 [Fulvia fulva]KAK4636319.1 hypothetical protein CLAFUR4_01431 [Fulvia fulva]KAK4637181.1 hypothetical protein CLAFUR0_01432 [Fulvia fulva]UJO11859.1 hypothetical protein CLAFUR5_01432 [Fulvia fulva]WPV10063.1 hypothetical protein CLAFUW4_01430 [Fulvia fulva]WPV25012.1 hypothetical protein CLAFUW7_01435 [Fulvia fulva]